MGKLLCVQYPRVPSFKLGPLIRGHAMQIVVATNVAETSITIDDVTCVIDAGRVKELGYDTERGIARLQVKPSLDNGLD